MKSYGSSQIAALLLHGGCFTKGNENWNSEQAKYIAEKCDLYY